MGQARVMIVSERPRRGTAGERRTTISLVPRWGAAPRMTTRPAAPAPPAPPAGTPR